MNKTEQNLTKRQLRAIPLILEARSIGEGVKKAGVSRTTFYEWLKHPHFKDEFERQRKEIVDFALHQIRAAAADAADVLRKLLSAESENVRLRAATTIIEHVSKFNEHEELAKRLDQLEEALDGQYRQ